MDAKQLHNDFIDNAYTCPNGIVRDMRSTRKERYTGPTWNYSYAMDIFPAYVKGVTWNEHCRNRKDGDDKEQFASFMFDTVASCSNERFANGRYRVIRRHTNPCCRKFGGIL